MKQIGETNWFHGLARKTPPIYSSVERELIHQYLQMHEEMPRRGNYELDDLTFVSLVS
jgi:hypothetical protein